MYPDPVPLSQSEIENSYGELFDSVAHLQSRTAVLELSGGLTNKNIKVMTPERNYVARISTNESSLLAIDRKSEFENSKIAASVGIGAEVFDFLPEKGLLVIGYLEGHTLDSLGVDMNLERIAKSCRTLHEAPNFVREFNMFDIQKNYLKIVQEQGFRIPSDYLEIADQIYDLERILKINAGPLVACNNDLLPGNFIDGGEKIWLIDYEYSGNNDRCFELGNIWSEAKLGLESLEKLVTFYFQEDRPDQYARAWLYAIFAKYGWTLWASIQDSISTIDFDFWSWGMEKYEDSRRLFGSMLFKEMVELASK